jgi:DNA-binding NarL/FixJ family response regulator
MSAASASRAVYDESIGSTNRLKCSSSLRPLCRLLLAHGDEETSHFIQDILETCQKISILGRASEGSEAVALAIVHQPDIILIDVHLPVFDGAHATRRIKEICPRTVVIAIAEQFTPSVYSAIRTAGAAAFVCKRDLLGIQDTMFCALEQSRWNLAHSLVQVPKE